ncbi:MAG: serine/threonine protein kinase [Synechococcales cyanobacterium T60_A2020_003]|nr:serine/threonine protein kinase [Synechococcales cyanobacterium T60_A2020_003]
MAGQILGDRYEVQQQLGKKSGRWTLLAQDLTDGSPVILKLIFIDDELKPDDLRLFKREIEILKVISHPSTPRYLGYFEIELPMDGKALALVQSYVEGKSIDSFLKEGRTFSEREVKHIAKELLKIVDYLHMQEPPIIHRDIKPSNVLLASQPDRDAVRVCLVDFGSVKSLTNPEATSLTLVGTQGYMSPEQMGGRTVQASDLYSLGVTLITALTGLEPTDLPMRGMRFDFGEIATVSDPFAQWLKQMIQPGLDRRFTDAQEALTQLRSIL